MLSADQTTQAIHKTRGVTARMHVQQLLNRRLGSVFCLNAAMPSCYLLLQAIHETCVIHRDIKPANIFMCPDNVVKVGDLGVAKALNKAHYAQTTIGEALRLLAPCRTAAAGTGEAGVAAQQDRQLEGRLCRGSCARSAGLSMCRTSFASSILIFAAVVPAAAAAAATRHACVHGARGVARAALRLQQRPVVPGRRAVRDDDLQVSAAPRRLHTGVAPQRALRVEVNGRQAIHATVTPCHRICCASHVGPRHSTHKQTVVLCVMPAGSASRRAC